MTTTISFDFFDSIQVQLDADSDTRDKIRQEVRELDRACRNANAVLNRVHTSPARLANEVADEVEKELTGIREHLQRLSSLLPEHKYHKYADMWNRSVQQACFLTTAIVYLREERLISADDMASMLEVRCKTETSQQTNSIDMSYSMTVFHITIDDYLHSLCTLISELFVKELHSGFQLLNLKNDMLRKRFDGIKYEVKRIEEVVYDLTLRGLKPDNESMDQ
ncbi:Translin [Syncephalis plumigaleata]|nr:Translin [Syncephalis plumigaleata]